METTEKLKEFLTDDEILSIAEMAINGSTLDAIKRLRYLLIEKWKMPLLQSREIVFNLRKEFE